MITKFEDLDSNVMVDHILDVIMDEDNGHIFDWCGLYFGGYSNENDDISCDFMDNFLR